MTLETRLGQTTSHKKEGRIRSICVFEIETQTASVFPTTTQTNVQVQNVINKGSHYLFSKFQVIRILLILFHDL